MTNEQGRGVIPFDEANSGCRSACVEGSGNGVHHFEIELRISARGRREQIPRHEKVGRERVGDALRRRFFVLWPGFLDPADERLALMMSPVPNFMRERKSLALKRTILADRDDRGIVAPDDPGFAALELAEPDTRSEVKGDSLEVDLPGFANAQIVKEPLCRREPLHERPPFSSSGGKTPSSSRSCNIPRTSASESSSSLRAASVSFT